MFSKSKRFMQTASCAPPVGQYSLPEHKSVKLAGFEKSARWTENSDETEQKALDNFDKSFNPSVVSSVKKKKPPSSQKKVKKDNNLKIDVVRKSLEVDIEFQQSKVNALLEKIKSLEIQRSGSQQHSQEIEKTNEKLHELLAHIRQEKSSLFTQNQSLEEKVKILLDEKSQSKENLDMQLAEYARKVEKITSDYLKEKEDLVSKLKHSEDMNVDFREQLESVETMMTDNIRDLSQKYECLEDTLDNVQTNYNQKLQRSNSLVEKIRQANENSKQDLETMQDVYNNLKLDYQLRQDEIVDKDTQYQEKEVKLLDEMNHLQEKVDQLTKQLEITEGVLINERKNYELIFSEFEKTKCQLKNTEEEVQRKSAECTRLNQVLLETNSKVKEFESDNIIMSDNLKRTEVELYRIVNEKEEEHLKSKAEHSQLEKLKAELLHEVDVLNNDLERAVMELNHSSKEKKEEKERFDVESLQFENEKKELTDQNQMFKSNAEQISSLFKTKELNFMTIKQELEENIVEVNRKLEESNSKLTLLQEKKSSIIDETELKDIQEQLQLWQSKYKELETKVGPFMSQLEQFEFEKQTLLNEHAYTQHEMTKLSDKYASILGHQNNKQKIHHIKKLKEENITLKNDVFKLRGEISKLKRNQLDNPGKKFDTSKAFRGQGKENSKQPLKESNS